MAVAQHVVLPHTMWNTTNMHMHTAPGGLLPGVPMRQGMGWKGAPLRVQPGVWYHAFMYARARACKTSEWPMQRLVTLKTSECAEHCFSPWQAR